MINDWYQTHLGATLLKSELAGLASVLPLTVGYYMAQIDGPPLDDAILATSPIHNYIMVNPENKHLPNDQLAVQCNINELPFVPESIDAIVMLHTLEFSKNPKLILKEVYDSLIKGGYVIIFSFNPHSLWGLAKTWKNLHKKEIWQGNWFTPEKLQHWLLEAGFSVGDYQTFYFRPPTENTGKMLFLEGMGQLFWPYCGASCMYVAQKKSLLMTPIGKLKSFIRNSIAAKVLLKPASRATQCNQK